MGRGQESITYVSEDEDTVSMAMSSLFRLIKLCELTFTEIGRLEVGTESAVDRGKSTKSFLMSYFEADHHHSVEGVDTVNACYGGTNAFFGTTNWIQGQGWNGRFGIVVCSDPAVHPDPAYISGIGASSICLIAGSGASFAL